MADTVLQFAPEAREAGPKPEERTFSLKAFLRARLRFILLVVLPALALVIGFGLYLAGGRYISTDNAYVGAQKVLITPDISGKIANVAVREGQHVAAGDTLFEIDPTPFRLALQQAQSKLDSTRTDFANLKSNLKSLTTLAELVEENVKLKKADVDRKTKLFARHASSQLYAL